MAKFVYSMEKILNIKYKLEETAKANFGEKQRKLHEEELKLQGIYDDIKEYENILRSKSGGNIDITELKWTTNAIEVKKEQAKKQRVQVNIARKNVDLARKQLNEAITERKTHEKLKERQFNNFLIELRNAESKEIDEIVNYKFTAGEMAGQ